MVKKALTLGLLLALSVPASAGFEGMNDSYLEARNSTKPCVKSSNSTAQEIDEDSDEGRSSKTKKIASQKSEQSDFGFWSTVKSVFKKIFSYFSY